MDAKGFALIVLETERPRLEGVHYFVCAATDRDVPNMAAFVTCESCVEGRYVLQPIVKHTVLTES